MDDLEGFPIFFGSTPKWTPLHFEGFLFPLGINRQNDGFGVSNHRTFKTQRNKGPTILSFGEPGSLSCCEAVK